MSLGLRVQASGTVGKIPTLLAKKWPPQQRFMPLSVPDDLRPRELLTALDVVPAPPRAYHLKSPSPMRPSMSKKPRILSRSHATKKPAAQLDAEIRAALLRPISQGPAAPKESLRDFAERVGRESKSRQKRLHQALLRYPALLVTDRRGRQTLLISSGEMSNPTEGTHRVTMLLPDGPQGHITRKSITRLAQDLSRDLAPERIEPIDEEAVMSWVSTPEYIEGSERVLEVQRRNRR